MFGFSVCFFHFISLETVDGRALFFSDLVFPSNRNKKHKRQRTYSVRYIVVFQVVGTNERVRERWREPFFID